MPGLKECPFCGGEAKLHSSFEFSYVSCRKCGIQTPVRLSDAEACNKWNTRRMIPCEEGETEGNWHTGTPTEEAWYLVLWRDTNDGWRRLTALLWDNLNKTWYDDYTPDWNWCDVYHAEVIAWMPIPAFKEKEDGRQS